MLNERMIQIIKEIIKSPYVSRNNLISDNFLTRRQVDYSVKKINEYLKDNTVKPIKFLNECVNLDFETHEFLIKVLKLEDKYILSNLERSNYIFLLLVTNEDYLSLNHFIDVLEVSKSTIVNDLKSLEEKLFKYSIQIVYSRKKGYYLLGDEGQIRYYLMSLVMTCVSLIHNKKFLDLFIEQNNLKKFVDMLEVINNLAKKHHIHFVENRLAEFIYSFIFLEERFRQNPLYIAADVDVVKLKETNEFRFSDDLLNKLSYEDKKTIMYLTTWLLGISEINISKSNEDLSVILSLVDNIIARFQSISGINFENKEYVKNQILLHFRWVYYRIIYKLPIVNPLKDRIKIEYEQLYVMIKLTMRYLEEELDTQIPDDEIAYLVIHFAAIIEKSKEIQKKEITAVVVCPNGIGSSMIIYIQLKILFPQFTFLSPIEKKDLSIVLPNADVIFSTSLFTQKLKIDKPYFVVNFVMSKEEKQKLTRDVNMKLGQVYFKMPSISQIMQIVEKYVAPHQRNNLEKELLQSVLKNDPHFLQKGSKPYLHEIIKETHILLDVKASDKYEALKIATNPLLKDNIITQQYIDKMMEDFESDNCHMVISKGVAFPHTKIKYGANDLAIGITVLNHPVKFGNKRNDPVKYIFSFSAVDKERHLQALSSLVTLLSDKRFYEVLDSTYCPKEILDFIKEKEIS